MAIKRLTPLLREVRACRICEPHQDERPARIPLPHPSPRNNIWLKKNPWFKKEVLPYVRRRVRKLLVG